MIYSVNNVHPSFKNHKYTVIRDCMSDVNEYYNGDMTKRYWYWCSYDDLTLANEACRECGNGIIVESESIEPLSYGSL